MERTGNLSGFVYQYSRKKDMSDCREGYSRCQRGGQHCRTDLRLFQNKVAVRIVIEANWSPLFGSIIVTTNHNNYYH